MFIVKKGINYIFEYRYDKEPKCCLSWPSLSGSVGRAFPLDQEDVGFNPGRVIPRNF